MLLPVLKFPGTCAQAIALYEAAFGARVEHIAYYRDEPDAQVEPGQENWVLHSQLSLCGGSVNMSDTEEPIIHGNHMLLNAYMDSADAVARAFHALSADGHVVVELGPQFFSPMYASVEDRFGVRWQMITGEFQ